MTSSDTFDLPMTACGKVIKTLVPLFESMPWIYRVNTLNAFELIKRLDEKKTVIMFSLYPYLLRIHLMILA